MAPKSTEGNYVLHEDDTDIDTNKHDLTICEKRKYKLIWHKINVFIVLHLTSIYAIYLVFTSVKLLTLLFTYLIFSMCTMGITVGVHRLWSHRAFKVKLPLGIFLMICNSMSFQLSIINWARDHRIHHKYTETDADPYNANRGFFYSHVGWQIVKKHPLVMEKGKTIDFSDLYNDPILRFQKKYYYQLIFVFFFFFPTFIPWYFWNESLVNALFVCVSLRYCIHLHCTWFINSLAHLYGQKPYDKNIFASENSIVSIATLGEGWHNYHHTFPWDYKASELGKYSLNWSAIFIEICAKLGLAYDLKTVSDEIVRKRIQRTGDGTHSVWGWGDKDLTKEEQDEATILAKTTENNNISDKHT